MADGRRSTVDKAKRQRREGNYQSPQRQRQRSFTKPSPTKINSTEDEAATSGSASTWLSCSSSSSSEEDEHRDSAALLDHDDQRYRIGVSHPSEQVHPSPKRQEKQQRSQRDGIPDRHDGASSATTRTLRRSRLVPTPLGNGGNAGDRSHSETADGGGLLARDDGGDGMRAGYRGVPTNTKKRSKRQTLPEIAKRIPVDALRPHLNLSLVAAAKALEISSTTLKRLCRHYGIKRWPFRQIAGIDRTVGRLEAELQESLRSCTSREMVEPIAAHIRELYVHREGMVEMALWGRQDPDDDKCSSTEDFGHETGGVPSFHRGESARSSSPFAVQRCESRENPAGSQCESPSFGGGGDASQPSQESNYVTQSSIPSYAMPQVSYNTNVPDTIGRTRHWTWNDNRHHSDYAIPVVDNEMETSAPVRVLSSSLPSASNGSGINITADAAHGHSVAEAVAAAAASVAAESKEAAAVALNPAGVEDCCTAMTLAATPVGVNDGQFDASGDDHSRPNPSLSVTNSSGGTTSSYWSGGASAYPFHGGHAGEPSSADTRSVSGWAGEAGAKQPHRNGVLTMGTRGQYASSDNRSIPASAGGYYNRPPHEQQQQQQQQQQQWSQQMETSNYPHPYDHRDRNPSHGQKDLPLPPMMPEWYQGSPECNGSLKPRQEELQTIGNAASAIVGKTTNAQGDRLPSGGATDGISSGCNGVHNAGDGGRGGGLGGGGADNVELTVDDVRALGELVFGNTELYDEATAAHVSSVDAIRNTGGIGNGSGVNGAGVEGRRRSSTGMDLEMSTWRARVVEAARCSSISMMNEPDWCAGSGAAHV